MQEILQNLITLGLVGDTLMFEGYRVFTSSPNTTRDGGTNTLIWTTTTKSNVTSLGNYSTVSSECTGLALFNSTIKSSINYLYLNCNSMSSLGALTEFSGIAELHLMCCSNLTNLDGLADHSTISILTLQNCGLTSLGNYDSSTGKYSGGLTGCKGLTMLSVQNNSGLTSLVGIEQATNLAYLISSRCNLTDISSLFGHSKICYLDLNNNPNLVSVKYIQCCKALNWIYLSNNTNMSTTELDWALNGSDTSENSLGGTVLIKQCANGYQSIPKKYWDLFESTSNILDYSYSALGVYLEDDTAKWVRLASRDDLYQLNLTGQSHLTPDSVKNTLKKLTSLRALSINGMSQIVDISFLSSLTYLNEIDLRGISNTVTDLSVLNNLTNIKAIGIGNTAIDLSTFETAIDRVSCLTGYGYTILGGRR